MSDPASSSSKTTKWLSLFGGIILVLGGLSALVWSSMGAWMLWKQAHPAPPTVVPHISVDVVTTMAGKMIGEIIALFIGIRLLQGPKKKEAAQPALAGQVGETILSAPVHKAAKRTPAKRWNSCNVLNIGATSRRLWTFAAGKSGFSLSQEQVFAVEDPLPVNLVGRDWKALFQPKLNIAWLPVEQVFLRVAQLPTGELEETMAMVELQLEKLSPLPVTQIVWTVQVLPQHVDNLQTVIVIIMARDLVEKFLGDLEGIGYLPDRLELPILDQLQATCITEDGAYLYPDTGTGKFTALVAWWYGGGLRSLGLLHVPSAENRDALLKEQLLQMAWAGEMEGWLHSTPRWHLVADEATAASWQPMFQPWLGHSVEVQAPLVETQLAAVNANRAARSDPKSGLLPIEYLTRYHQEFVDRLWMRGLGAVLAVYVAGVLIYLACAAVQNYRTETIVTETSGQSRNYTNVLQLKAQLEILENRQVLKFASLDCWKITAELLPESVTIQTLEFKDGKHFSLSGKAPGDQGGRLTDFNESLRKATRPDGKLLFENLTLPTSRLDPGGATLSWNFSGDLARAEDMK